MRKTRALTIGFVGLGALVACGTETSGPTSDDDASITSEGAFDASGSATLQIGEERWDFDNFSCAFGPEATGQPRYSFSSTAFGEHTSGARVQMQAEILDLDERGRYEGANVHYEIYINDIEFVDALGIDYVSRTNVNPDLVELGVEAPSGNTKVTIDGFEISGTGRFDDQRTDTDFTLVEGSLTARCGSESLGTP